MDESLAIPANGRNSFPHKDDCLDSVHHLARCMTAEQMEAGRRLGLIRSRYQRRLCQAEKALLDLIAVQREIHQHDQHTGSAGNLKDLRRLLDEVIGSDLPAKPGISQDNQGAGRAGSPKVGERDISSLRFLSSGEDQHKTEKPSLSGSLQRVRAKKPGYRQDTDYSSGFLRFWSVWPKKVGKIGAYAEWVKLNPDQALEDRIIAAVNAHLENTWHDQEAKYILDPERWLKRGRWEDEVIKPKLTREQELDQAYQRVCKEIADAKSR